MGKEDKIIGNIKDEHYSNQKLYVDFLMHGHPFNDPRCRDCGLLPICNGGCPDRRLAAKDENDRVNLCDMLNHDNGRALEDFLYDYYLTLNR